MFKLCANLDLFQTAIKLLQYEKRNNLFNVYKIIANNTRLISMFIINVDCQSVPFIVPPQKQAKNKLLKAVPPKKDGRE